MRKLILKNWLSPGDIVMLTAAVRDLHACYPGEFITDVRTPYPQLWENNPYITPLSDDEAETIECQYPLIHHSNQRPYHFIHAFIEFLNAQLGLRIAPTAFKGDIHLTEQEKNWTNQVEEVFGDARPFWLILSGGKLDFTIKWWSRARFQSVVDAFRDRIQFVQIGADDHYHPALSGVHDLRGKTDLRQLVRLVYHSQGALCGVTALMHLAVAVQTRSGRPTNRPCVVVAGGREPSHWERYPSHQFLDTIGRLSCCSTGGCWRSRVVPIGDGDEKDSPQSLCVDVVNNLARCMDLVTVNDVVRAIDSYFTAGQFQYLNTEADAPIELIRTDRLEGAKAPAFTWEALIHGEPLSLGNSSEVIDAIIPTIPPFPHGAFAGDGVVICGGGSRLFPSVWVCINLLRDLGCKLPIELWHLGREEVDETMESLVRELGVRCADANEVRALTPIRNLSGWELKSFAIAHSRFKRVLLLDADNMVLTNATEFFDWPQFKQTGAVFWPDFGRLGPDREAWRAFGVSYSDEPEFESGQILVDKERCWPALMLALWFNARSDFFFTHVHGDKETFHMAFRRLVVPFAMPERPINPLDGTMCQHDFNGLRIFQHRNLDKWRYDCKNRNVADFWLDDRCRFHLKKLQGRWNGEVQKVRTPHQHIFDVLNDFSFRIERNHHEAPLEVSFVKGGLIGGQGAQYFRQWHTTVRNDELSLRLETVDGKQHFFSSISNGRWVGECNPPTALTAIIKPHGKDVFDIDQWRLIFVENVLALPALEPDSLIMDVGATIGAFAALCLAKGSQYVYAFEENSVLCACAARNLHAVWQVYSSRGGEGPYAVSNVRFGSADSTQNAVSLGSLLREFPKVDILRIRHEKAVELIQDCGTFENTKRILIELPGHSAHFARERMAGVSDCLKRSNLKEHNFIQSGESLIFDYSRG